MEIAGFDADTIVTQLMELERIPLNALQNRKDAAKAAADAIDKIRSNVDAFRLNAAKLADVSLFDRYKATVSHSDIAAATVGTGANAGTLTFTVDRLAQAHGLRSLGTVAADTSAITAASLISVATGTRSIGVGTVRAGSGLTAGGITLKVTQASAGATTTGSVVAASTTIGSGNDTVTMNVNGAARTVTLAAGTYDRTQLAAAFQAAIDASGGGATASVDSAGAIELTTTREGSAATLQITGGSALADLGLGTHGSPLTGTDGIFDVGGTITTVSLAEAGQAVAVDTGSGTLDVSLSGGLRVGTTAVKTVSTGSRSLADVAAAINGANAGVSAAAVKVGDGAWRLQLTSRSTGEQGRIAIDTSVLTGGMIESSAAQNAKITIGSGPGAYDVEASSNTFSNVLGGVSITAKTVSTTAVSVDIARNDDAVATDIAAMVAAANTILAEIKVQTRFDSVSGTSGTLAGNSTIRRLADQLRASLGAQVDGITGGATNGLASSAGVQLNKDGTFSFDRPKFLTAVAADPAAVARLFGRGGTGTGSTTFASAAAQTRSGTYAVEVTTAATQATTATLFSGGATATTRLGVRAGTTTVAIDVSNGQTPSQIIAALNDSFAENAVDLVAEADGAGLRIRANDWGTTGDFEINTDVLGAGTWDDQIGVDVLGTIGGVLATGSGRRLTVATSVEGPAAGLAVDVAGGVTGAAGSVTYQPGLAARVVEISTALTTEETGGLSSVKDATTRRIKGFTDQMTRLEDRLSIRESSLRRQYSALQTLLSNLQNQGSWLTSQIATLPTNG